MDKKTEKKEIILAHVIRNHPILYDKEMRKEHLADCREMCQSAWQLIAEKVGLEAKDCEAMWAHMKRKYPKHRTKLIKGRRAVKWPAYKVLHKWFKEHNGQFTPWRPFKHSDNKKQRQKVEFEPLERSSDDDNVVLTEIAFSEEWIGFMDDSTGNVQLTRDNSIETKPVDETSTTTRQEDNSDANTAFGQLIVSMVRELPAERHTQIRLSILQYASHIIASESNLAKDRPSSSRRDSLSSSRMDSLSSNRENSSSSSRKDKPSSNREDSLSSNRRDSSSSSRRDSSRAYFIIDDDSVLELSDSD